MDLLSLRSRQGSLRADTDVREKKQQHTLTCIYAVLYICMQRFTRSPHLKAKGRIEREPEVILKKGIPFLLHASRSGCSDRWPQADLRVLLPLSVGCLRRDTSAPPVSCCVSRADSSLGFSSQQDAYSADVKTLLPASEPAVGRPFVFK